jgi:hypothetical protein
MEPVVVVEVADKTVEQAELCKVEMMVHFPVKMATVWLQVAVQFLVAHPVAAALLIPQDPVALSLSATIHKPHSHSIKCDKYQQLNRKNS